MAIEIRGITITRPSDLDAVYTVRPQRRYLVRDVQSGKEGVLLTAQDVPGSSDNTSREYLWAVQYPSGYEGGVRDSQLDVVGDRGAQFGEGDTR